MSLDGPAPSLSITQSDMSTPATTTTTSTFSLPIVPRPYSCPSCPSTFTTRDLLTGHITLLHTPPHKCPHCDETFTQRRNLSLHQCVIHRNLIPEICSVCAKIFGSLSEVNTHVLKFHRKGIMKFGCDHCDMAFGAKVLLERHMERSHSRERDKCATCGIEGNARVVRMHVDRVHGIDDGNDDEVVFKNDGLDQVLERIEKRFGSVSSNGCDEKTEVLKQS